MILTVSLIQRYESFNYINTIRKMNRSILIGYFAFAALMSCTMQTEQTKPFRLITVDPGHFHAALVQKTMYEGVDSVVHVYAHEGNDLHLHLQRIRGYNTRNENPTHWKEEVYTGNNFFEKMIAERSAPGNNTKSGDIVVLSGNNQKKAAYILQSLQSGFNVLADKPMAINTEGFKQLKKAFAAAARNNVLLYDIMTERFEITTILQRELSQIPEVFGALEKGTPENPAITMESRHYFYKTVSGNILKRPPWFMDVRQQGEGIADVTTHLVDLVLWASYPEQVVEYEKDVEVTAGRRWPTGITLRQFTALTQLNSFPAYLREALLDDTTLQVYSNGEIHFRVRGTQAKVSVRWEYKAPEGAGDSHYAIMRGTKANLVIKQGAEEHYKPVLYIEPVSNDTAYERVLREKTGALQQAYPGIDLKPSGKGWEVVIPEKYKENHEEHFARVMQNFLSYLKSKSIPAWEVPNMLTKYYITTKALELAQGK